MATLSQEAFPNIWRVLGLSVAAGYAGLGLMGMLIPVKMADTYGLRPKQDPEADKFATTVMTWISVRDLSIGAALFTFYYQSKPQEMGTLILSGMILCAADCILVYRYRQDMIAHSLPIGAAIWGWIGWNLIQL